MTVLVPVKAVATVDEDFELGEQGLEVDPDFLEWELGEWDSYAIEEALRLREADESLGEIVLATVGARESEDALRAGLAMGADRAVRIWDEQLDRFLGPLAIARLLAAQAAETSPSLILCGAQSADAANGATGVALAAYLGLPHVAVVREVALDGGRITVARELEGGVLQNVRLAMPAVLTVQTGANEPRYATLRAIKQAEAKPLELTDLATLGVDLAEVPEAELRRLYVPESEGAAEMIAGDAQQVAERIAALVRGALAS